MSWETSLWDSTLAMETKRHGAIADDAKSVRIGAN